MASFEKNSYFKIYRSVFECDELKGEPFDKFHAWIWMISKASFKPEVIVVQGEQITLQRGQLFTKECELVEEWGWSRGKVRRTLERLKKAGMIDQKRTRYGTIITLENYGRWQGGRTSGGTSDGTSDGTSGGTSYYLYKESQKNINNPKKSAPTKARSWGALEEWANLEDNDD